MAILNILKFPDPRLRNKAKTVKQVDNEIRRIVQNMLDTMYDAQGIGLAAIQVGIDQRIIVLDLSEDRNQPLILINPEIMTAEGEIEYEEGCLSVPGVFEPVKRAASIQLRALDLDGQVIQMDLDDLMAICVQHEIDHLDGKLFVDYLSRLKQDRIRKKMLKEARKKDDV